MRGKGNVDIIEKSKRYPGPAPDDPAPADAAAQTLGEDPEFGIEVHVRPRAPS